MIPSSKTMITTMLNQLTSIYYNESSIRKAKLLHALEDALISDANNQTKWLALYHCLESMGVAGISLVNEYLTHKLNETDQTTFWQLLNIHNHLPNRWYYWDHLIGSQENNEPSEKEKHKRDFSDYLEIMELWKNFSASELALYFKNGIQKATILNTRSNHFLWINSPKIIYLNHSDQIDYCLIRVIKGHWNTLFDEIMHHIAPVKQNWKFCQHVIYTIVIHAIANQNYYIFEKMIDALLSEYSKDKNAQKNIALLNISGSTYPEIFLEKLVRYPDKKFLYLFLEKLYPGTENHIADLISFVNENKGVTQIATTMIDWLQALLNTEDYQQQKALYCRR